MTRSPLRNPLVAIIGATGTGKSQLAVEIAKRHNGEIINGDAMQLYEGLPIITNKITPEERQGIPHHLLGCIGLQEQTWVVGTFVRHALKTIQEIRSRGRLPILVGGTHYYTQSLLLKDRLAEDDAVKEEADFVKDTAKKWPILQESTDVLLEELKKVDPIMADRWHPNDRRKISRSLEIYLQSGKKASDIYAEQRSRTDDSENDETSGEPELRFSTLVFWVHGESETLRERLDKRVDKMLRQGLLQEVDMLSKVAAKQAAQGDPVDETRGIWVSIGFKEFKDYAQALQRVQSDEASLQKLQADATEKTQIATRQYAKRQIRWIRIKLVNALAAARASPQLYLLDGSDVSKFDETVVRPASDLTQRFLQAEPLPPPSSLSPLAASLLVPKREYDLAATPEKWVKQHCEVCNVTCVTPEQWQAHTKSKTHRKLTSKRRQAEEVADSRSCG